MTRKLFLLAIFLIHCSSFAATAWPVGSNYIPSSAVNELEMWQAPTFDPERIDRELGWAENLHMNTMRVFLHDLLWTEDVVGFKKRIHDFLGIAEKHHIKIIFVLFDSCWNPRPHLGTQPEPTSGRHNSQWLQSPGLEALNDPSQYPRLKQYVQGVVSTFSGDPRILAWDVWNEPDNLNVGSYDDPRDKLQWVGRLLPLVFQWAKEMKPTQPLTSGLWEGDWSKPEKLTPIQKTQIENSELLSFHSYEKPATFEARIRSLELYGRPIICTEFLARPLGSSFEKIVPIAKSHHVGVLNWGFVAGKTQTYLPWKSWQHPVGGMPVVWFHDIFNAEGKPWSADEARFLTEIYK